MRILLDPNDYLDRRHPRLERQGKVRYRPEGGGFVELTVPTRRPPPMPVGEILRRAFGHRAQIISTRPSSAGSPAER